MNLGTRSSRPKPSRKGKKRNLRLANRFLTIKLKTCSSNLSLLQPLSFKVTSTGGGAKSTALSEQIMSPTVHEVGQTTAAIKVSMTDSSRHTRQTHAPESNPATFFAFQQPRHGPTMLGLLVAGNEQKNLHTN